MLLSKLLASAGLPARLRGSDVEVTDVQIDSRRCGPGSCFVAVRGWKDDGHRYIRQALARGASAVVCEQAPEGCDGAPVATVEDSHRAVGLLAQAIRDWPVHKLTCVGVTGTNGKTTVTHMMRAVLAAAGHETALLGTISYEIGSSSRAASTTTPDPLALAEMMSEMVAGGATHMVMEVSSHALDQDRVGGIRFRAAVFTNLTGDHLDYHGNMSNYLAAKLRLFESLPPEATAVLNRDDPHADRFAGATAAGVCWYGLSPAADVHARIRAISSLGTEFLLTAPQGEVLVRTPMIGRHNVQNCLAAAGACLALGVDMSTVAEALGGVRRVPGRLERVAAEAPYEVFVDYAHTDDALRNVLASLRPLVKGKIIVVFGCGGDRDRTKRPRMAQAAQEFADRIVITSDNPRSESPQAIIDEIVCGLDEQGQAKTDIDPDRRKAIELAIGMAGEGDVVLIAGKGHETYQIVGDRRHEFHDAKVAAEIIRRRERGK